MCWADTGGLVLAGKIHEESLVEGMQRVVWGKGWLSPQEEWLGTGDEGNDGERTLALLLVLPWPCCSKTETGEVVVLRTRLGKAGWSCWGGQPRAKTGSCTCWFWWIKKQRCLVWSLVCWGKQQAGVRAVHGHCHLQRSCRSGLVAWSCELQIAVESHPRYWCWAGIPAACPSAEVLLGLFWL